MKAPTAAAFRELFAFLDAYSLHAVSGSAPLKALCEKSFKRYYPLLILEEQVANKSPWRDKGKTADFRSYLKETVSDLCQAMMLAIQGLYKPAYLSLRSGLENFIRCIGLSQDQNVLALTSVYELIDLVKATRFISDAGVARDHYLLLKAEYKALCGYVHTSSSGHMALTTLVGAFPRFREKEAEEFFAAFTRVATSLCVLLCMIAPSSYRALHHKHFDIVSDALPAKAKGAINA